MQGFFGGEERRREEGKGESPWRKGGTHRLYPRIQYIVIKKTHKNTSHLYGFLFYRKSICANSPCACALQLRLRPWKVEGGVKPWRQKEEEEAIPPSPEEEKEGASSPPVHMPQSAGGGTDRPLPHKKSKKNRLFFLKMIEYLNYFRIAYIQALKKSGINGIRGAPKKGSIASIILSFSRRNQIHFWIVGLLIFTHLWFGASLCGHLCVFRK